MGHYSGGQRGSQRGSRLSIPIPLDAAPAAPENGVLTRIRVALYPTLP